MAEQVFVDYDSRGQKRPWQKKKLQSLDYATYLEMLSLKKSARVKECGNVLEFAEDGTGKRKLARAWFCKSRLCPLCNWRRSMKASWQLEQVLEAAHKREPQDRFIFLTLTEKNAEGQELRGRIKNFAKAFEKLIHRKAVKQFLVGYVRSLEITINDLPDGGITYHHHYHVLLMVRNSYFKKGGYLSQKEWTDLWQEVLDLDYTPIVNVESVKRNKRKGTNSLVASAKETAKYQVKPGDYLTARETGEKAKVDRDLAVVKTLEEALTGLRQISFGGLLKQVRAELHLDDIEDGNLVHTTDEKVSDAVRQIIVKWNASRGNYFLTGK
ncbi:protein rep [Limosilactobacillus ingluviei]|nr:protein rep [Limosilactobacillus ingluviei]